MIYINFFLILPLILPLNLLLWVLHTPTMFVRGVGQTYSFSSTFLLQCLLLWCFRTRSDQPREMLILSVFIAVSFLFSGPCGTPRRQRVIGTVCLSNYTQILWGRGKCINCVSTNDFMKTCLISLFFPRVSRVTGWLTLQRGLLLCITSYCLLYWVVRKSWSRLLARWHLFLTCQ